MPAKKNTAKKRYLTYLRTTIIPDSKASGRTGTTSDLRKCERLIRAGKKDAKFAHFLRTTLIPDFKASGSEGYVSDFKTCVRYIAPKRRK